MMLILAAILVCATSATADQWRFDNVERVVAITDIHGAFDPMVAVLQQAEVIDDGQTWVGAKTNLVVVGDIVDRGPDSRKAMELLMRLEVEAVAAGGKVHVLIGNHEVMNLVGDLRYVSKAEYAAFAEDELAEEREREFSVFAEQRISGEVDPAAVRTIFDQKHPAGFFAHRHAFSADGQYGKWLLSKPVVIVINETAFVHGGLSPMISGIGLDGVNGRLRGEMVEYVQQLGVVFEAGALLPSDGFHDHPELLSRYMLPLDTQADVLEAIAAVKKLNASNLHSLDGPLWYRGNVVCSELVESDKLAAVLQAIDARRVVIGHTPTPGRRVLERLDGRIIEIDTGMLNNYYGGSANVLIIDSSGVSVVNEHSDEVVEPAPHPRNVGSRPAGSLTNEEIEELLASGNVVSRSEDAHGRDVVTVSDDQRTIESVFAKRSGRGFYPEVAAYRLDKLLGLEMVPATVQRELDGVDGSLQFKPVNSIDEAQRQQVGSGGAAWCPLNEQWNAMFVFDVLTYNDGRNGSNILYDLDFWQLMLVDHGKAFSTRKGVPTRLQDTAYEVGQGWKDALTSISDDELQQWLGDVLDQKRLRALIARGDKLSEPD